MPAQIWIEADKELHKSKKLDYNVDCASYND